MSLAITTRIDAAPSGPANAIEVTSVILIADRTIRMSIIGGPETDLALRLLGILIKRQPCTPRVADLYFIEDMVSEEQQHGPRACAQKSDRSEQERQGGLRQLAVRKPQSSYISRSNSGFRICFAYIMAIIPQAPSGAHQTGHMIRPARSKDGFETWERLSEAAVLPFVRDRVARRRDSYAQEEITSVLGRTSPGGFLTQQRLRRWPAEHRHRAPSPQR